MNTQNAENAPSKTVSFLKSTEGVGTENEMNREGMADLAEKFQTFSAEFDEQLRRLAQEKPFAVVGLGLGAGLFLGTSAGAWVMRRAIGIGWRTVLGTVARNVL